MVNKLKLTKLEKYGDENYCNPDKIKETKIERYGHNHFNLEKSKQTKLEKYGDENYTNLEKHKQTILKKYGVKNISQIENVKEKKIKTTLINYGVENPSKSPIIQDKIRNIYHNKSTSEKNKIKENTKNTCKLKYGGNAPMYSEEVKHKRNKNNLEKYGVENPSQYAEFEEKKSKSQFKYKEYILPSGKVIKLQGYEPKCFDILLEIYSEKEILHKKTDVPEIWYIGTDNKKHRYYPDFYIPKENMIIEVKSTYTYEVNLEINLLKQQACLELGYKFEFKIL